MARDYTKYNAEGLGENLNKRQLVFTIVKDYVEKNNPSFEDLQKAFPDEVQGSKGFIRKEAEVKTPKHFNMREPLKIKNGAHVVVSNQWGTENIKRFIDHATNLGYSIEKSSITKSSSQNLNVDIELRRDGEDLIGSIKNFVISGPKIKKMYDSLLTNFKASYSMTDPITMVTLIKFLIENFEREIYNEFLTNSHPSGDEYGITIEDLKQDDFDWWSIGPHLVVTRVGEIDLNPIVNLDEDDENMLERCCEMLDINEDDKYDYEDYISDYMGDARFSVGDDLFKEVMEEL